jgi:hypothetical protein
MPDYNFDDNDTKLLTPLLLMALLIVCSFLYFAYVSPTVA